MAFPQSMFFIDKAIFESFVLKPYKRQSICHGPSSVALASLLRLGFNQRSTVSQDGHSVALPAMTLQSLCVHNVDSASTFLAVSVRVLLFIFDNSNWYRWLQRVKKRSRQQYPQKEEKILQNQSYRDLLLLLLLVEAGRRSCCPSRPGTAAGRGRLLPGRRAVSHWRQLLSWSEHPRRPSSYPATCSFGSRASCRQPTILQHHLDPPSACQIILERPMYPLFCIGSVSVITTMLSLDSLQQGGNGGVDKENIYLYF